MIMFTNSELQLVIYKITKKYQVTVPVSEFSSNMSVTLEGSNQYSNASTTVELVFANAYGLNLDNEIIITSTLTE